MSTSLPPKNILASLDAITADLAGKTDRELGGAANAARSNADHVATFLRRLHASGGPLPRHGGKAAPGKIAQIIGKSADPPVRFNRQNFDTNEWCRRMLAAYDEWERAGASALAEAQALSEAKAPTARREAELERENLLLRAQVSHMTRELALLRGLIADTGRMP
jgi:hypothetical protein